MTDEQIIEMAKESGIPIANVPNLAFGRLESGVELLKTFAKLVAQHERKVCVQLAVDAIAFNGGTAQLESHVRQAIEARDEA